MRLSQLCGKTLREAPADAETDSHRLLVRAGFIRPLIAGVYTYLPLGWRTVHKIEAIIREEMNAAGGQEITMPVLQPRELWAQSGREAVFGPVLFHLRDRREHTLVLAPTAEEVVTALAAVEVRSYRDLPLRLYQIGVKCRDELRPRGGVIRLREFLMKDLYSFDADEAGLEVSLQKMIRAYQNVFRRCGVTVFMIEADPGAIGGTGSKEFAAPCAAGEDTMLRCPSGDYAANQETAELRKVPNPPQGNLLPLEEVATPGIKTIAALAQFLGIPENQTLKAVFYTAIYADGNGHTDVKEVVFGVIRGDLDVNEVKFKNKLGCLDLRLATDEEVAAAGLVAGSASPLGLQGIKVVADDSITLGANFVAGANKPDTHVRHVNYPRDFGGGHSGGHCPGPPRRSLSALWPASGGRARRGDGTRLQAGHQVLGGVRRHVPGQGRRTEAPGHGLLRHWSGTADGRGRGTEPRRQGHRLAPGYRSVSDSPLRPGDG